MATIKDIAERVGFSIATVSRVLNYDTTLSVSDDTRRKIFQAAEDLSYRKKTERHLSTYKIAVVYWYTEAEELNDLYYMSIRLGVETECEVHKLPMTKLSLDRLSTLQGEEIHGIIAIGKFSPKQAEDICKITENIVFVDCSPDDDHYDSVVSNLEKATINVLDHLVEQGHQKIGFIGGRESYKDHTSDIPDPRQVTFKQYLEDKQLYMESNVYCGEYSVNEGYRLMKQAISELKEDLPTAFFAGNDSIAIGCMRALLEANISIPNRVSIIGVNDISISKYVFPPLSTVKVYTELMGKTAVNLLLERLTDRQVAKKVILSTQLEIRESSK